MLPPSQGGSHGHHAPSSLLITPHHHHQPLSPPSSPSCSRSMVTELHHPEPHSPPGLPLHCHQSRCCCCWCWCRSVASDALLPCLMIITWSCHPTLPTPSLSVKQFSGGLGSLHVEIIGNHRDHHLRVASPGCVFAQYHAQQPCPLSLANMFP